MCAACGIADHIATAVAAPTLEAPRDQVVRFAALRHPDFRMYFGGTMLSMMADNIEHVISYWVLYQTFHSPMLAGFAVISHWLPALFLSVYVGALADRFDCRKIIQVSQLLFMSVSAAWGVLFLTNSLQVWEAMLLLVIHGLASCLWFPPEQLLLHDMVGKAQLPSAVRLNSTARSLGLLAGPAVGSVLLLGLGPAWGIFANVLIYLPLSVWLLFVPYTGHLRDAAQGAMRRPRLGFLDALHVLRDVSGSPALLSMVALGGLGSLFIGSAVQPQMPEFAADLGAGDAGLAYGALLAANAAGAVAGGVLLEVTGVLKPNPRTAIVSTLVWSVCMIGFAASGSYLLALLLLVAAGAANLASQSISQTVVQLLAPSESRGRIVGVYNMSAQGLRAGGGVTVGVVGAVIGIHWSLAFSAAFLLLSVMALMAYCRQPSALSRQPALASSVADGRQLRADR
jgi:MFS family permease